MRITIIGSGYVGLVTGACLAEYGNEVLCLDLDAERIHILQSGGVPIHEPGLAALMARNVAAGRLAFTTDIAASVAHGEIQFIAVGTPPGEDGSADLRHVLAAARNIGHHMNEGKVVVNKSTVPVGTVDRVRGVLQEELALRAKKLDFSVVSNPEFLKEGAAVEDFMRPDRIVIGADEEAGREKMRALYAPFVRNHDRILHMDARSAELTKYAANAMLATRISFMNELANLAEDLGADIEADALVIVTEWKAFRSPDFGAMRALLKAPVIFDGRNLYDPQALARAGFDYYPVGRAQPAPDAAKITPDYSALAPSWP